MITYYLLLSIFLNFYAEPQVDSHYSSLFKPAVKTGIITDINLAEVSGMVASVKNESHFWVINDSGNHAKLYLINKKGETIHSWWIMGVNNTDWEDLAMKHDTQTGKSWILIGDIGDNYAIRKSINILEIEEPTFSDPQDTVISLYKNYHFRYEDGPRDAETIMIDPNSSRVYVISKREKNVRIYGAPKQLAENDTMLLSFSSKLPFYNITSGDIAPDGNEILLKNYDAIFYWNSSHGNCMLSALSQEHELIRYTPEPQGESICWDRNGNGFYTLSEKSWAKNQVLYFFERDDKKE